jgi:antitoxin PrlF
MKTTVSEKGQITIPKPLRVRLGLRKGQVLDVRENKGKLVIAKQDSRDPIDELFGSLKLGRRTDEIIDELRGSEKLRRSAP